MNARLQAILAALFVVIGCGGIAAWYYFQRPARLDFDKLGGTVLVYEIDADRKNGDPDADLAEKMAEALQRRLDLSGRGSAEVFPLGKNRVEIRIPKTDNLQDEIREIKNLISKVGSLEFRILANAADDFAVIGAKEGQGDARLAINNAADDPAAVKELEEAQQRGLPPPPPREIRLGELKPKKYQISTANGIKSAVSYSWVELGPQERQSLNLDNAAEADPARNAAWVAAKNRRNQALQLPESANNPGRLLLEGALFYSRECKDRNLPEAERLTKKIEYFVLTRDPEFRDLTGEARTGKIDGSYLVTAYSVPGPDKRPTVYFTFNAAGGELLANTTRKNVSESQGPAATQRLRRLGIILDGLVMSAPTVNSEIRTTGQITGNFTQPEVDALVNILRSGALPATLKPAPVSETEVAPKIK